MNEIREISSLLDRELEAIKHSSPNDLASEKIGGKASSRVVKLLNPKVITSENKIEVMGPAFLISLAELKKAIKQLRSAQHSPDCPAEMFEGFETAIQYIRREWLHR